jgi:TRAP-type transport system small permease protein
MLRLFAAVDRAFESALFGIFLVFSLVGGLQVFNRFVLNISLSWSEEFQKFGHIWMVFLAIPIAYRRGAHIGMDMALGMLPDRIKRSIEFLIEILWLILAVAIGYLTTIIMEVARNQDSPGLGVPMNYVYFGLTLGSTYLAFCVLRRIAVRLGLLAKEGA